MLPSGTYAATKRSLELIAETLRLEVEPLGVNVIEIVTGAVKSRGQTYFEDYELPGNSVYKPIEATIKSRAQGNDGLPRMPLEEYTMVVADEIIKRTPGKFWYGEAADMVRSSTTAMAIPQSVMVSNMTTFPRTRTK
jgi:1-acylglycerone phosphate reductase